MKDGFWRSMFDLSFKKFVTLKVLGVVYVIGMILIALVTAFGLYMTITAYGYPYRGFGTLGFTRSAEINVVVILGLAFLYWLGLRMTLEFVASVLRIADNTSKMRNIMEEDEM